MLQNPELNKSAFSVMIQGHPSSGKSTALKEVATRLNTFFEDENLQVLPIFSELQIRYSDIELSTTELWEKIVLGVNSYEFQTSKYSDSLNSFFTLANDQKLTPILFIDTLDFLISDQGISPKREIGRVWDEFVTAALEGGVNIIFTTRSDEWTHFFSEYNTIDDQISIDLPELMLPEIDTFHVNASIVDLRDEFLQYTRVMQALLPILRHPREPVYEKMSDAELRDLIDDEVLELDESEMKLLAQRCYLQDFEKSEFYTSFTTNLYKWFIDKMSAEVPFESNKDLLFDSPISIYYEMSWQKWQALSVDISDQEKSEFRKAFIEVISEENEFIHVSGHPNREDLKDMYNWVKPKSIIPVHGEHRHMIEHINFAKEMQVPFPVQVENGDIVKLAPGEFPEVYDKAPSGRLFLDGSISVEENSQSIKDRKNLGSNGYLEITILITPKGNIHNNPIINFRGLPDQPQL